MSVSAEHPINPSQRRREPTRMELLFNVFVFVVFLVLWSAFAYALVANQAGLDGTWTWLRELPWPVQDGKVLSG